MIISLTLFDKIRCATFTKFLDVFTVFRENPSFLLCYDTHRVNVLSFTVRNYRLACY